MASGPSRLSRRPPPIRLWGRGWGGETRRVWAQGHQQRQVSFYLCKDSLTPEPINTLMTERRWDSRPAPPPHLPSSPPPLWAHLPPLPCLLSLLSVPLCLLSGPPLLSPSSSIWVLASFFPFLSLLSFGSFSFFLRPQSPQLRYHLVPCSFRPQLGSGSSVSPDSLRYQPPQGRAFVMVVPEQRGLSFHLTPLP